MKSTAPARSRLQHADENTSDYLEVIADLLVERGEARLVDVADRLGVNKATASKKLQTLQRAGLVRSEPYRSIFLAPPGAAIAAASKKRHMLVLNFLIAAGVPPAVAELDAEGIEHHVSPQTIAALKRLTDKLAKRR
jgi:DtxR family manganese transport transcriptional regulator